MALGQAWIDASTESRMSEDDLSQQLNKIIPKNLDDIIRKNRDKMKLVVAADEDLIKVAGEINEHEATAELDHVYFYKRVSLVPNLKIETLTLVGYNLDGSPYHTSEIMRFDARRARVLTKSGSIYILKNLGNGEPPSELLMMICAMIRKDGAGSYFGVPEIFL